MYRDALGIAICSHMHPRTLKESTHYCTAIISFHLSEENPQFSMGLPRKPKHPPVIAKED